MNIPQPDINKGNILIVDDTPENLQVLSATLSERGYKVRGVVNGKMAIRAARSASPDLILLDIRMPDMNGYEVCEQLKGDPQTTKIPVIFISALDEVLDKVKAFNIGGVDYITKPFQVEEVLARVENQLTIQRLQKQLMAQNEQLQKEILERKKAEEAAAAASQAKSQFLANMSHELRTPLNAILGFTQVMTRDPFLSTEQVENLRIINRSGEHLLELINDVLDLSKIEAGIIALYETNFDLYRLLDNLEEIFLFKAERKRLNFQLLLQPEVPQYIKADEKKLRACLMNLLSNALKFTQQGSITLRVIKKTEEQVGIPIQLEFEVEDTGVGIAPEEIETVFQAFVQTESGKKSAEGTGLGLTITRKFVEFMGGNISLNSVVGAGTTFRFNIHCFPVDASEVFIQPIQRVIGLESNQELYRILVVDDTPESRLLLIKLLQPIGFEVKEAENGLQAIAMWENWQPHLIWIDTRMPIMDGIEATKQIRAREKAAMTTEVSSPPRFPTVIIALTASAFEEKRSDILAAGCDEFVRKPFKEEELFAMMARYLGVRYLYEELPLPTPPIAGKRYALYEKPDSFFLPLLEQMPLAWVQELHQAANEVNEDLVRLLLEQIPDSSPTLAETLKDLLEDFRLDRLVHLARLILK
ncbi:MAG: response regulator [Actinomycetota bacterium]